MRSWRRGSAGWISRAKRFAVLYPSPTQSLVLSVSDGPMVSCLMVTRPVAHRVAFFQRSIAAYCAQTHRNKELIIVLDHGSPDATSVIVGHVASLRRDDIRIEKPRKVLSLGALRNLSRERANGEILCQWDDDDFHHPLRVEQQLKALIDTGGQASLLQEVMHFFVKRRELYCTNWRATDPKGLPGTLMCKRSASICYPETSPSAELGEDLAVVSQLQKHSGFHTIAGSPHLYVYVNHGGNTWADAHHWMLATKLGISRGLLLRREAQLREGLRPFDFGADDVAVQGYNGLASVIGASDRASHCSPGPAPPR